MANPLHQFLGGDALAAIQAHAQRLERLQAVLAASLPGKLGQACRVANIRDTTLVLSARSAAAATRVRQMTPTLVRQLRQAGHAVEDIRVKVGLVAPPPQPEAPVPREVGEKARASLVALRDSLPEDAPLRTSLDRLITRSR